MTYFNIHNRRYVGSKYKISDKIVDLILENCEGDSFFDVFGGTGIMTEKMMIHANSLIINDFLYSNEIIYNGFFLSNNVNIKRLSEIVERFNQRENFNTEEENYCSINFGNKYFSKNDAYIIGEIRENLNNLKDKENINNEEFNVLLSSLIYSIDKIANTVGHYDAYRKIKNINDKFEYILINPINTEGKDIKVFKEDSNELAAKIKGVDITFIDPPYNSRQYSRFYHVLENIVKWEKPELFGVAMKPEPNNMSDYCRVNANVVFRDLISKLDSRYIVVTYNNTYNSKSNSSRNKIEIEEIEEILKEKGKLKRFSIDHNYFNTGKTEFADHKEYVYIVEVK